MSATLPKNQQPTPERPWVDMATSASGSASASLMICSAALPSWASHVVVTPALRNPAATSSR